MNINFTLTKLRRDILAILQKAKKPMKAYEILDRLQEIRPNAKPPTVYRVLEFFEEKHVIHQLANKHAYVLCQIDEHDEHGIDVILTCKNCDNFIESHEERIVEQLKALSENHQFDLSCSAIEVAGLCKNCK